MAFLRFILKRARKHWQILLTLSLGVILTTSLLASGPLLVDTVVEMGLHLTLESASVPEGNLRLTASTPADPITLQALDAEIQDLLSAAVGDHLDRVIQSMESGWLYPNLDGQDAADLRVKLHYYEDIQQQLQFVAGGWPIEISGESLHETGIVPAVISDSMARALVLRVGDRLPLYLAPTAASDEPSLVIEVAGVVQPQNPLDPYWFGEFNPLTSHSTQNGSAQFSIMLPQDSFFAAATSLFPDQPADLAWHGLLQHQLFTTADIQPFQVRLAALSEQLAALPTPVTLDSGVPQILATFQGQLESVRVPLYIFVAEVMLLVLYYVTMVAALSMRQVEREFAILRSRGTSGWQITRIQLLEALIILTVALLCGPWLGASLVNGLSWVGPLADVSQTSWALDPGQSAWVAAGIGTVACLASLLLPLGPALKRSIVVHQQMVARSTQPPWWQRYYLDVFVLVGGLVLLWRLRLYGEMTTGGPGGAQLDWLLLLSPVAFLLGAATILLRIFPLVLQAMAYFVARGEGLEAPLALWQASRNPTHVTRLVLLLTLAIALGNLSTGLNITLDQSEVDRAVYLAGRDLRLVSQRAVPLVDLQSTAGVQQLSGMWRGRGTVDLESAQSYPGFELLAVEPDSFAQVTAFRRDFADQDINELVSYLSVEEGEHPALLLLPGKPASFGLWAWSPLDNKAEMDSYQRWIDGDSDVERVAVLAKLQTAQGELFTVDLHKPASPIQTDHFTLQAQLNGRDLGLRLRLRPDNQGWVFFEGALPELPTSSYPLSLHSLWFQNQTTRLGEPIAKGLVLVIDELTVTDADTMEMQIVEDFEAPTRTKFLNTMQEGSIHFGLFTQMLDFSHGSGEHGQVAYMTSPFPEQSSPLRLRQTWTADPLPALASPAFLQTTALQVGDVVRTWINDVEDSGDPQTRLAEVDFRIAGAVNYFPTMYQQMEAGFLITSRDLLLAVLNDTVQPSTNPNEVLLVTDGRTSLDSLSAQVPMLSQSWQAESVRKTLKANPLALGLRGVTFFGSALTILLSLVGFATHFYMTVRQREMLYGVMRAMGMSARQLYGWIVLEQAVLILTGLILGTGLGIMLNQITLPRLPVSLGDRQPIPPFIPRADWVAVGLLYLILTLAFMAVLGIVTALLRRARIHRILRIGQE